MNPEHLNKFQQLMLALDIALTGNTPPEGLIRQIHHYPDSFEKWIMEPGGNPVWYLSDSGYSRVVYDLHHKTLFLTYNSRDQVVDKWVSALNEREALLKYLHAEQARLSVK